MSTIIDSPDQRLADYLVAHGHLDAETAHALVAKYDGRGMPAKLADDHLVAHDVLAGAVAAVAGLRCVPPSRLWAMPEAIELVGIPIARQVHGLPLAVDEQRVVVAFASPPSEDELARLRAVVGRDVVPVIAEADALRTALDEACGSRQAATLAAPLPGPAAATSAGGPPPPPPLAAGPVVAVIPRAVRPGEPAHIDELLRRLVELNGSDLHLTAGARPTIRVHGLLQPLEEYSVMESETIERLVRSVLTEKQQRAFENDMELDTAYAIKSLSRFRMNVFRQRGSVGTVLRTIPIEIPGFDTLGLPPIVKSFADLPRGLVLVTGPTGSGKSTTLAALLDIINKNKAVHIISAEDPIEFVHQHQKAIVNQREVGQDTPSFASALKRALREDPDVILVGEMRDLETIHMALTAAETGHLVFGTLHTQSAPQTVDRMVDVFPPEQQGQIRVMLATTLQAVVTQQLVPTANGRGRCVASEVLVVTAAVRNLIREAKGYQIPTAMQAGGQHGMVTMDQSLAALAKAGRITTDMALERAMNAQDLRHLLGIR